MALRDDSWLSLTPEPERLLPEAGERLVLSGRKRRWEAWLRESAALASASGEARPTAAAGALVRDVVDNHDALALGLPGEREERR